MRDFRKGQIVQIPCEIQPGAFPDERLITVHTDKGIISGFVKAEYLTEAPGGGHVEAKVIKVSGDELTIRLPGSFFTAASGVTSVSPNWAYTNLQHATT